MDKNTYEIRFCELISASLASQGCQGSVRDRLCLPDRFWAFARELCSTAAAEEVGASGASYLMRPQGATTPFEPFEPFEPSEP